MFPKEITQDEANAFLQAFIGDGELCEIENDRTKDVIQSEIERYMHELNNPNSELNGYKVTDKNEYDRLSGYHNQNIEILQQEYKTAPAEVVTKDLSREMKLYSPGDFEVEYYQVSGYLKDSKEKEHIKVRKLASAPVSHQEKTYSVGGSFGIDILECKDKSRDLIGMELTYEEAKAIADEAVFDKLGYTDYQLFKVCAVDRYIREQSFVVGTDYEDVVVEDYAFIYMPTIDGVPVLYFYSREGTRSIGSAWAQKFLCVHVSNAGLRVLCEYSSLDIGEKLNDGVELLPFEDIQDIFRRYIPMKTNFSNPAEAVRIAKDLSQAPYLTTINVTDIRLGYMRIAEKDNIEAGLMVPVWMFYGLQVDSYESQGKVGCPLNENNEKVFDNYVGNSFLIINAVDGTIIAPSQGY